MADLHDAIAAYYSRALAAHGTTARGVDWPDEPSQQLRHQQFLRLIGDEADASIADLGCGYGSFLTFLRSRGHRGPYVGYDVAPAMIAAAEERHGSGADRQWVVAGEPTRSADYVVASGIFNVKQDCASDTWQDYVDATIDQMAAMARRGWGFNVLSLHSDPARRRADLFYADPAGMLNRLVRRHGRSIALLQDYGLYEFTFLMRRSS